LRLPPSPNSSSANAQKRPPAITDSSQAGARAGPRDVAIVGDWVSACPAAPRQKSAPVSRAGTRASRSKPAARARSTPTVAPRRSSSAVWTGGITRRRPAERRTAPHAAPMGTAPRRTSGRPPKSRSSVHS
jgi:hypothetical protein